MSPVPLETATTVLTDGRILSWPNRTTLGWLLDLLLCPTATVRPVISVQYAHFFKSRPEVRREYPLNLSISIRGGKETNKDSLSNGE